MSDGSIRLAEQTITLLAIDGTSTNYIVKKGSLKGGVKRIVSDDQHGVEKGQAFARQLREGSMTLQFIATGDKKPDRLQYATVKDCDGANINIIVAEVGNEFGAFEESMVSCTIFEALTPPS